MMMSRTRRCKRFCPEISPLEGRIVLNATVFYVNADAASSVQDGSSWAHAFSDLQAALTKAAATAGPMQIWIAEGTYKPSLVYSPDGVAGGAAGLNVPNMETFDLPNNVSLYGGFRSGMKSLSQRNPAAYPTILSGDLAGNDVADPSAPGYAVSKADNAWHVVTAGDDVTQTGVTATLDGLQIVDGYADGPNSGGTLSPFIWGHSDGGGVYIAWGSNVTLNDDTFQGNFAASDGGGVFANTSNLTATHSTFVDNAALIRAGGLEGLNDFENGISHTSLVVDDDFEGNTCAVFGGAIVGEGAAQGANSSMIVQGSTFVGNQAAEGGAITIDTLNVLVNGSTFRNNIATVDAGALATTNVVGTLVGVTHDYTTTVTHSSFIGNIAQDDPTAHTNLNNFNGPFGLDFASGGGALVDYMNGNLNVDHDEFRGNEALNGDGGAILNGDSSINLGSLSAYAVSTSVKDSLFVGNQALTGNGGAIASETDGLSPGSTVASTLLSVSGSSFLGNLAAGDGGAIYLDATTAALDQNSFLFNLAMLGNDVSSNDSQVSE
jgi:predicted outer membrane repeat protein